MQLSVGELVCHNRALEDWRKNNKNFKSQEKVFIPFKPFMFKHCTVNCQGLKGHGFCQLNAFERSNVILITLLSPRKHKYQM